MIYEEIEGMKSEIIIVRNKIMLNIENNNSHITCVGRNIVIVNYVSLNVRCRAIIIMGLIYINNIIHHFRIRVLLEGNSPFVIILNYRTVLGMCWENSFVVFFHK